MRLSMATGHTVPMARIVAIGTWGSLKICDLDEEPPEDLRGAAGSWIGDARRRPSQLQFGAGLASYVAVWPPDGPPPMDGPLTEHDLDGVALTMPVSHVCFICKASIPGLYPDSGLPFFRPWARGHARLKECPSCGAAADAARLQGVLPMPNRRRG
jgi:hypothetical protein